MLLADVAEDGYCDIGDEFGPSMKLPSKDGYRLVVGIDEPY
jgi:hypothetical protein